MANVYPNDTTGRFRTLVRRWTKNRPRALPVSYTHLDVYKRQISKNTIPPSGTFTPDSTSCLNAAVDTNKSPYVMTNGNIRTRFSVSAPVLTNGIYTISSTGYTDQTRTSSGTVSQTSSSSVKSRAFSYAQSYGVIQDNLSRTPYVLMPNGSVYSWGDNTYGQVGRLSLIHI